MKSFGFRPSDWGDDSILVWPEHEAAFNLFSKVRTQWRRAGMNGDCTGLDYNVVLSLIDALKLPAEDADLLFEEVQHLENAALVQMADDRTRRK